MTLHVAPGDGFFGTQTTVIWIFYRMNLHMALSVVGGCMVFAIEIPNIILINMNNVPPVHFHVAFDVAFFTLFIVNQVFF